MPTKKLSPRASKSDLSDTFPKFLSLESRVFTVYGKDLYLGREKIDASLRSVLRDDAMAMQASRLWEILNASVVNEAYNLALIQSKDFDHVQFAKAMKHWSVFMMNIIQILAKKE